MILSQYFQNWSLRLLNYEKSSSLWCSGTVHGLCYLSEIWHQDSKKTKEPHCKVPERLMINFLYKKQNLNFLPFLPREFLTAGTFTECVQTIYSSEKPFFKARFWFLSPPHHIIQAPPLPSDPSALSPRSTILESFDHMTHLKSHDRILALNLLYQVPKLGFGFHKPATFYEVTPRKNEEEWL